MEPFEVMSVMNPGNDPEFGSGDHLSRNPDLGAAISDSDEDGGIYSKLRKLRMEEDYEEGGKDSDEGEEENVDKTTEKSGGVGDSQNGWDCVGEKENIGGWPGYGRWREVEKKDKRSESSYHYPLRPNAEDCLFYLKNGSCKFGSRCKFNHPLRRKFQHYSKMGGRKFGRTWTWRYKHTRPQALDNSVVELNSVGLPLRSGEKDCSYYMRSGSCKYRANCKFNHPDPSMLFRSNRLGPIIDGSQSLHGSSESAKTSSSSLMAETVSFEAMAHIYPSEKRMIQYARKIHFRRHQDEQMQTEEFPERPDQPESDYARTGDCKFKRNSKTSNGESTPCIFNDEGLPLRPDQGICVYYFLYGICKFGPVCKFDHPIGFASFTEA